MIKRLSAEASSIMDDLQGWGSTDGLQAVEKMKKASSQTIQEVLTSILEHDTVPASHLFQITHLTSVIETLNQMLPLKIIFDLEQDNFFEESRFLLALGVARSLGQLSKVWARATSQIVRVLQSAKIEDPETFLYLAGLALAEDDETFAITLLAHTDLTMKEVKAKLGYDEDYDPNPIQMIWSRVETERDEMFRSRWLPAAISVAELVDSQKINTSLLKDLYPNIWDGGYSKYRERVLNHQFKDYE